VTSEVIQFKIRKEPPVQVKDEKKLFQIIKCAFTQRRKTLVNSLVNTNILIDKEQGIEILKKLNIKENTRPEELSLEDFAKITDTIVKNVAK